MTKLFVSYRRNDSQGIAGRIYDRLVAHFGRDAVLMDIDSVPLGVDFRHHVLDALSQCDVVLAVIGEKWASPIDETKTRLDDPRDFVRIEIEAALNGAIPIIPVLVGRTKIPAEQDLPQSLAELAYRNAIEVDPGVDFHSHVERLIRGIELLRESTGSQLSTLVTEPAIRQDSEAPDKSLSPTDMDDEAVAPTRADSTSPRKVDGTQDEQVSSSRSNTIILCLVVASLLVLSFVLWGRFSGGDPDAAKLERTSEHAEIEEPDSGKEPETSGQPDQEHTEKVDDGKEQTETMRRRSSAAIEMPLGQKAPTEAFERLGKPWTTWPAYDGYQPRSRWSADAPASNWSPLRFMRPYHVLYEERSDYGDYLLLGLPETAEGTTCEPVGWIRSDYTVSSTDSLRTPHAGIYRKVIVLPSEQIVHPDPKRLVAEVKIRSAPRATAPVSHPLELFNVFFVFGETQQETYGGEGDDFVLVGKDPSFDTFAHSSGAPDSVVLGWIPRQLVAFWNTREAVEVEVSQVGPEGEGTALAFLSAEDAVEYQRTKEVNLEKVIQMVGNKDEQPTSGPGPFGLHDLRFPVLEWNTEELRQPIERNIHGKELIKIGLFMPYSLASKGSPSPAEASLSPMVDRTLARLGIDGEDLRSSSGMAILRPAYVWRSLYEPEPGAARIRRLVMMHESTVQKAIDIFDHFIASVQGTGTIRPSELMSAARTLKLSGLSDYSTLLRKPIRSPDSLSFSHLEFADMANRLTRLKDRLKDDSGRRSFSLGGASTKWYWIDPEEEIP